MSIFLSKTKCWRSLWIISILWNIVAIYLTLIIRIFPSLSFCKRIRICSFFNILDWFPVLVLLIMWSHVSIIFVLIKLIFFRNFFVSRYIFFPFLFFFLSFASKKFWNCFTTRCGWGFIFFLNLNFTHFWSLLQNNIWILEMIIYWK